MDLNDQLTWMVIGVSGFSLVMLHRYARPGQRSWVAVFSGLMVLAAAGRFLWPERGGYLAGIAWAALVLVPELSQLASHRRSARGDFAAAEHWLRLAHLCHPFAGYWRQARLMQALHALENGRIEWAKQRLERLGERLDGVGVEALVLRYRMENRWREMRDWLDREVPAALYERYPELTVARLRCLLETNDLPAALWFYDTMAYGRYPGITDSTIRQARIMLLAFCGRPDLVARLFRQGADGTPAAWRDFWLATAYQAAEAGEPAERTFRELQHLPNPLLAQAAAYRLAHPPAPPAEALGGFDFRLIEDIEEAMALESDHRRRLGLPTGSWRGTKGLIGLNVLVFAASAVSGGATNVENLFDLGALLAPAVVEYGEWWRLLAALFLHYGALHLTMNMLGLGYFGAYVEGHLGTKRFLATYFISGLGSMLLLVGIHTWQAEPQVVVGASGCVMGLLGAVGAVLWRAWRHHAVPSAKGRLMIVATMVAFQAAFDLATPEVSFVAHASGFLIGFGSAACMRHKGDDPPESV